MRSIAVNAAKGSPRAQRLFTDLVSSTEAANKRLKDAFLNEAIAYKVEWEIELLRRKRCRIENLPDPVPHPDDIEIDMSTGEVHINGPMTPEEKVVLDRIRKSRIDALKRSRANSNAQTKEGGPDAERKATDE